MLSALVAPTDHTRSGGVRGTTADRVFAGRAMLGTGEELLCTERKVVAVAAGRFSVGFSLEEARRDRFATVVRLTGTGIAVRFTVPFTPENFDERVRL